MRKFEFMPIAHLVIIGLLILLVIYPLGMILLNSFQVAGPGEQPVWGVDGYVQAFTQPDIPNALFTTFWLGFVRIIISMILAVFLCWLIVRTDLPGRNVIEVLIWLSFMLPVLPMTLGWISLLDPYYGLLNQWFEKIPYFGRYLNFDIYSYGGIIWAHLAQTTAYCVLFFAPAFRNMDASLEEAAFMSGASTWRTLPRITFPALLPAILGATMLGLIKSLESFEIEVLLGWPKEIYVFSSLIYKYIRWTEPPQYASATAISVIFMLIVGVLIWFNRTLIRKRQYTTVTGKGFNTRPIKLGRFKYVAFGFCMAYLAIFVFLPFSMLILGTFMKVSGLFNVPQPYTTQHWLNSVSDPLLLKAIRNSLLVGVSVAVIAPLLYLLMGYISYKSELRGKDFIDIVSWLPWSVPGILLGVGFLWAALGPLPLMRFMYGTLTIIVVAILVKEMPVGMRVMNGALVQISNEFEEAALISGAPFLTIFRRILLPILAPSLIAIAVITFLVAIKDISIVVFLYSSKSPVLSVLMLSQSLGGSKEIASIMGLFIAGIVIFVAIVGKKFGMNFGPRGES